MQTPAEMNLYRALLIKEEELNPLIESQKYIEALQSLATLKAPIDEFFDSVMVMVDDIDVRQNRLNLLKRLRDLFLKIADISLL